MNRHPWQPVQRMRWLLFGWMVAAATQAQGAPDLIVFYDAARSGSGAVDAPILDLSGKGNHGRVLVAGVGTSGDVPAGMGGLSYDFTGGGGKLITNAVNLLHNAAVAPAGGFTLETWFKTSGGSGATGSIIDYAGTERIQLAGAVVGAGGLGDNTRLEFRVGSSLYPLFNADLNIADNVWHKATAQFLLTDASDNRNLRGDLRLTIDNQTLQLQNVVKTSTGDDLNRPIGFGHHPSATGAGDNFEGLLYNPKVYLGVDAASSTLPTVKLEVNRSTGAVTLRNAGPALQIAGYSLLSSQGTINSAAWNSRTGQVSGWQIVANSARELTESTLGSLNLGVGQALLDPGER
ncbi:MAG TPA: hypothetical protein PJ982_17510, partial [Lacipirellulaceae bacterium]|nr:hypothetical protein [Lacipirellulaceae bacterium]